MLRAWPTLTMGRFLWPAMTLFGYNLACVCIWIHLGLCLHVLSLPVSPVLMSVSVPLSRGALEGAGDERQRKGERQTSGRDLLTGRGRIAITCKRTPAVVMCERDRERDRDQHMTIQTGRSRMTSTSKPTPSIFKQQQCLASPATQVVYLYQSQVVERQHRHT